MGHTSEFPFGIYWWTLKNPKNQNFDKMKKNCWRYRHFTQCNKNHHHMRYSSWDRVRQIFFVILGHFLPNKWHLNYLEMSSFYTCATKNTIKWCMLTQIWSATDIIFCHFRPFFALKSLLTLKIKIWKKVYKKHLEILSFYTCVP